MAGFGLMEVLVLAGIFATMVGVAIAVVLLVMFSRSPPQE